RSPMWMSRIGLTVDAFDCGEWGRGMSIVAKRIDEIVKLRLAPLLKASGFTKSGREFHRQRDGNWHVVNVQASMGNVGDTGKFTINLGVFHPAISLLAGKPLQTSKPKEYECTVRERIGGLMPGETDYWWEVSPQIPAHHVAEDVASAVEQLG